MTVCPIAFADLRPDHWDAFARESVSAARISLILEAPLEMVEERLAEAEWRVQKRKRRQAVSALRPRRLLLQDTITKLLERADFQRSGWGARVPSR